MFKLIVAIFVVISFVACQRGTYPLGMNKEKSDIEYTKSLNGNPDQAPKN